MPFTHKNDSNRSSRLFGLASRVVPNRFSHSDSTRHLAPHNPSEQDYNRPSYSSPYARAASPAFSDHSVQGSMPQEVAYPDDLAPPIVPYAGPGLGSRRSSQSSVKTPDSPSKPRPQSLSVNYVPAKFTKRHEPGSWAHRRAKQGGGRDAFAKNAQRMGDLGTVDDDEGVVFQLGKGGLKAKKKPKLRWNRFKWVLFVANSILFVYGMATLISAILVWLNVFYHSDVIRVGNRTELILSTVAASLILLTSLIGYAGIILNNRAFLAVMTLLLWVCLGLLVAPGYMTYKQRTFNLEGKINSQWSRMLGTEGRLRIQNALRCCGYYNPFIEATQSPLCYGRSIQPGCKARYLRVERTVLETWYIISFALVPAHMLIILAALLCSNHITYRFGKGLTPKQYRLDMRSMAVIMDEYASQIAAQYGPAVAKQAYDRSSVLLNLDAHDSTRPHSGSGSGSGSGSLPGHGNGYGDALAVPPTSYGESRHSSYGFGGLSSPADSLPTSPFHDLGPTTSRHSAAGAALYDPRRDSSFEAQRSDVWMQPQSDAATRWTSNEGQSAYGQSTSATQGSSSGYGVAR